MKPLLLLALVLPWLLIIVQLWLIYRLLQRYGRALLHQDELHTRLADAERALAERTRPTALAKEQEGAERARAAGLSVRESRLNRRGLAAGTPAPNFSLLDLAGERHTLTEFHGRRVLLVFSDPSCGPCEALAPALAQLQQRCRCTNLVVVMISRGTVEANRRKAQQHGFTFLVLLQKHWEISKEYALFATPVAYLIDEQGVIARDGAIGPDAILRLTERVAST